MSKVKKLTPAQLRQAASIMAQLGGLKGGPARAKALTTDERARIARMGAEARWGKKKKGKAAS